MQNSFTCTKAYFKSAWTKKEYVRYIIVLAGVVKEMLNKVRKWDRFAKQIVLRTFWEPTESHLDEIRKKNRTKEQ